MLPATLLNRLRIVSRNRLVRASLALILAQVVAGLVGIAFWAVVSRNFAAGQVGEATTLVAVASAVTLLLTAGLAPALMLVVARAAKSSEAAALAWLAVGASTALGALAGGVTGILLSRMVPNLDFLGQGTTPLVLAAITGASATGIVADAVATSLKRAWLVAVRALAFSVSKVLLLIVFLGAGLTPVQSVGISWALCSVTTGVIAVGWASGWVAPGNILSAGRLLKTGMSHHHASALGSGLPPLVIPVMVTAVLGTAVSAQFSIAWMIATVFFMVSPAVAAATLAQGAADGTDLPRQLRHAAILTLVLIAPPVVICATMGPAILGLFGEGYAAAVPLLVLLALSAFPDAITNLAVAAERVKGRLGRATAINVSIGVVTVASTWLLLPHWGLVAPGIGWLAGQMAGTAIVASYALRVKVTAAR